MGVDARHKLRTGRGPKPTAAMDVFGGGEFWRQRSLRRTFLARTRNPALCPSWLGQRRYIAHFDALQRLRVHEAYFSERAWDTGRDYPLEDVRDTLDQRRVLHSSILTVKRFAGAALKLRLCAGGRTCAAATAATDAASRAAVIRCDVGDDGALLGGGGGGGLHTSQVLYLDTHPAVAS